jgi:hypothetical protein
MDNNRQNTLLLTVIAVATLLVAVIGATFAYFTARTTGTETTSTVVVTAARLAITYEDGTGSVVTANTNIEPSEDPLITKNFTLTPTLNTTDPGMNMPYTLNLIVTTNTFQLKNLVTGTSISYKLINNADSVTGSIPDSTGYTPIGALAVDSSGTALPTNSDARQTSEDLCGTVTVYANDGTATTKNGVELGTGVFVSGSNTPHEYTLEIYFMEDNKNQDLDTIKTFIGYIDVSTGGSSTQINTATEGHNSEQPFTPAP